MGKDVTKDKNCDVKADFKAEKTIAPAWTGSFCKVNDADFLW